MNELANFQGFDSSQDMFECLYKEWSTRAIADLLGVGKKTVCRSLRRCGIELRKQGRGSAGKLLPYRKRKRLFQLLDQGLSQQIVAYRLGIHHITVNRYVNGKVKANTCCLKDGGKGWNG